MWWTIGIVATFAVIFLAVLAYVAHNAEPILRRRVIANLQERFHTPVELNELHISVLKGLEVSGSGLRIGSATGSSEPPLILVRSFSFRARLRQLLEPRMRIDTVRVDGLRLRIPPSNERGPLLPQDKKKHHGPDWKIIVNTVACTDVVLTIETDKPGKQPLVFPIRDIVLHSIGAGAPMPFEAHLINPKPVGNIATHGHFGPWHSDEPRDTPVDGSYSFTHADLNTIKGINGMLSSTGNYSGTLSQIDVSGTTDTPDFSLDVSEHPVDLRTAFNATVDGTSGDTLLHSVHATLANTVLEVQGSVIHADTLAQGPQGPAVAAAAAAQADQTAEQAAALEDASGHMIRITVHSDHARIEDLLRLGAKTSPPLMNGAMTLNAHLAIPPGHSSVSHKMRVEGDFTIRDATFTNPQWQQTLDKLSARASGNPDQAKTGVTADKVASQMGGTFSLVNAVLSIPKLHYQMPGAQIDVAGQYSLNGDTFNFAGTARTQATASQMLTGWKSWLAKPFDKLLEKDGSGVEVPIAISGTRSAPKFGVDAGKLAGQVLSRLHLGGGDNNSRDPSRNGDPDQNSQPDPGQSHSSHPSSSH